MRTWFVVLTVGQALFAAYIVALYGAALVSGEVAHFNRVLPNLHRTGELVENTSMVVHLLAGALLAVSGPVQLLPVVRSRAPWLHRVNGRLYVAGAVATSLAGLVFIGTRGTVGGPAMDLGFALYGLLLLGAAVQALRHARAGEVDRHRVWALRLFVLGASSFLYRIGYGLWALAAGGLVGHTATWDGPLDVFMDFAFYLVPLAGLEAARAAWERRAEGVVGYGLWVAAGLVGLGTVLVALEWWLPALP